MYTAHTSALPFKDSRFRSQVTTWASTLACTSEKFRSSWRPDPNHTTRMQMGSSFQRKGPERGTPPLQTPSRKPSLLSKLILVPAICSYFATAFFIAFMSRRRDVVISSAYADTFSKRGTGKGMSLRARLAFSSPTLRDRGTKART